MIVSKIYTTENDELTAVVLEDGKYSILFMNLNL